TSPWLPSARPTTAPSPDRTLSTLGGSPASAPRAATYCIDSGLRSAVLSTTVQPAASAGPIFQPAKVIGKFQGTTAATTPAGSCVTSASSPSAAGGISALILSASSAEERQQRIRARNSIS